MTNSQPNDFYKFASEAVVESITIQSVNSESSLDITALAVQFNIYEDILSPFITAEITLVDGLNLLNTIPIIGQENITITFRSSAVKEYTTVKFLVYKVSTIQEQQDQVSQIYTLYLASPEFITNKKTRISKSFSKYHHEMVKELYDNYLADEKPLTILDPANDFETLIVPSWNPIRSINWIATRARSRNNIKECAYVFFERIGEGFFFGTLSSLASQDSKYTYVRATPGYNTIDGKTDVLLPLLTINQYIVENDHNPVNSMTEGRYRSSLNYYDPFTRTYDSRIYSSLSEFDQIRHVEKNYPSSEYNELYFESPVANLGFYPISSERIPGEKDYTPDIILRTNSQFSMFKEQSVKVSVSGNSNLHAGDVIYIEVPKKKAPRDGEKKNDEFKSGKFLVRSVKHNIVENQKYECFLNLVRDSIPTNYPLKSDIKSETTGQSSTNGPFSNEFFNSFDQFKG